GLDVGGVRELGVGHDRGRVGVGQDHPVALLLEDLAGLGARVVELAGLADDDRAGADEEDRVEVVSTRHQATPSSGSGRPTAPAPVVACHASAPCRHPSGSCMSCAKWTKRYSLSWGPGPASGWCCTLRAGTSRRRMPSHTPSFRFT